MINVPKIMAIIPKAGLETVMPSLFKFLSTTSVKTVPRLELLEVAILTLLEAK